MIGNDHEDDPNIKNNVHSEFQSSGLVKVLQACIFEQKKKTEQRLLLKHKRNDERLKKLEKLYDKSEKSRIKLFRELKAAKEKIKKLEEVCNDNLNIVLSKMLNEDQINALRMRYKRVPNWCNATLINAYKLRFDCGTAGYEEILRQGFPFPSVRTLTRKLENLKFLSGSSILEVFEFLRIKISHFQDDYFRDCMIVLDEMSITPGSHYDTSTNTFTGNVTLINHDMTQVATHGLVFMIAGLSARWKQVVRYEFTGDSVDGQILKIIIDEIVTLAENIGLRVHAITSDMGSANQAMWKCYGIKVSRFSKVINSCEHPYDPQRRLYFYADSPHAFKNAKAGFLSNEIITIPDNFVTNYGLPTNVVQSKHVYDVINVDKSNDLKLAPKLREEYLNCSNHFKKMRVGNARRIIHRDVGSALQYLAFHSNPERFTTGWFLDFF